MFLQRVYTMYIMYVNRYLLYVEYFLFKAFFPVNEGGMDFMEKNLRTYLIGCVAVEL